MPTFSLTARHPRERGDPGRSILFRDKHFVFPTLNPLNPSQEYPLSARIFKILALFLFILPWDEDEKSDDFVTVECKEKR